MLRSLKDLERYTVSATDGDIGSVMDFLLDDERWIVRYLVIETAGFPGGRPVLISPISFRHAEWSTHRFHLALTLEKVKNSPSVEMDEPVSRQHERDYYDYYGYPYYWGYLAPWGMGAYPGLLAAGRRHVAPADEPDKPSADLHLRSVREVLGYHIQGSDEAIGHVDDFIVDDESWEIRYLVIDTSNWWFGKRVLISTHWASRVSWESRKVHVDLSRQAIKSSPKWNATAGVNREYETHLYDYYGRPAYWSGSERPAGVQPSHHSGSHHG